MRSFSASASVYTQLLHIRAPVYAASAHRRLNIRSFCTYAPHYTQLLRIDDSVPTQPLKGTSAEFERLFLGDAQKGPK
jgi:hypothetical protein